METKQPLTFVSKRWVVIFKKMDDRKQKLIQALKDERLRFVKRGADPTEHDIAIDYLINGTTSNNPDKWELLNACMNDYDMMLSDYDC